MSSSNDGDLEKKLKEKDRIKNKQITKKVKLS